ncbi:MAG: gamma-glutamyltransferase, partial [Salinibacter sp.]
MLTPHARVSCLALLLVLGGILTGAEMPASSTAPSAAPPAATAPTPEYAENGMVVSAKRRASAAGAAMLEQGGNAVDAAVATGFALAVVHPYAGNIGGGGFMVIRQPDGEVTTIDHREDAPSGATQEVYLDDEGDAV